MGNIVEGNASEVVNSGNSVMSLHAVDDLKVTAHTDIGDSRVTAIAQQLLDYDRETMIWQDSPSPALMLPSLVKWVVIVAVWVAALVYLQPATPVPAPVAEPAPVENVEQPAAKAKKAKAARKTEAPRVDAKPAAKPSARDDTVFTWTLYVGLLVLAYQIYSHGTWFLRLKNISYKISSQRLAIESGIFSKALNTYELHQLNNGQVYKPWNLRLFGRENLYVSGLWLSGIRNAEVVRDLIRNAGQIEASRIEKARFR